jgi:hypothetical protein
MIRWRSSSSHFFCVCLLLLPLSWSFIEPGAGAKTAHSTVKIGTGLTQQSSMAMRKSQDKKGERSRGRSTVPAVSVKHALSPQIVCVADADAESNGQLIAVPGLLTESECQAWISFAERLGMVSTRPPGGRPERGNAYRDNFRAQINDQEAAASLWESGLARTLTTSLPPLEDGRPLASAAQSTHVRDSCTRHAVCPRPVVMLDTRDESRDKDESFCS